jgi:feruloyl-CoA synthase
VSPNPLFAPQCVDLEVRADGTRIVRSREPLRAYAPSANAALWDGARAYPARTLLAERRDDVRAVAWNELSYADARNSIAHALLSFAAQEIGVPTIPLAPARLRDLGNPHVDAIAEIIARLQPACAFADDDDVAALLAMRFPNLVIIRDVAALETTPTSIVDEASRFVDATTVAKVLFTSGTTNAPKGVITTHGMIVSNQVGFAQVWPYFDSEPPVLCDWLPWTHSFGGNKIVNFVVHRGGTLYIDDGSPTETELSRTLANLRAIAPTVYFNVPRGYAMLVDAMENDVALRAHFFSRLQLAFSAAAALPESVLSRFARQCARETTRVVPLTGGWGLTETAPGATCVHERGLPARAIGVPLPGVEIKLARIDGRDELRVRGPNVTPGYACDSAATRASFDDEGYFCSGDSATLVDENEVDRGFTFAGRIADNFKLSSGVWVRAAALRDAMLDTVSPLLAEVLLTGDDADFVGAILFLAPGVASDAETRAAIVRGLATIASRAKGRNTRIARALVAREAPSAAAGELTAKGTINRNVALARRHTDVARLYAHDADADNTILRP